MTQFLFSTAKRLDICLNLINRQIDLSVDNINNYFYDFVILFSCLMFDILTYAVEVGGAWLLRFLAAWSLTIWALLKLNGGEWIGIWPKLWMMLHHDRQQYFNEFLLFQR